MKIAVSLLSVTGNLKDSVKQLNETTADYLHLDVMDGKFVSNNTVAFMENILHDNKLPLDIHLMVKDVQYYINRYLPYRPSYITFHIELDDNIDKYIELLKANNVKVGLAINPDTKVDSLLPYLGKIDLILVMSVLPGSGGQVFNDIVLSKIDTLIKIRQEYHYKYLIEVDGGIKESTVKLVANVDMIVSGSYVTSGLYNKQIEMLRSVK